MPYAPTGPVVLATNPPEQAIAASAAGALHVLQVGACSTVLHLEGMARHGHRSRVLFNVQGLAGFMETDDGRTLVFSLSMSGATYPDVLTGLVKVNVDVAAAAAAFQQFLSREMTQSCDA